ncbi:MAG: hypothetical protein QOD06_1011, partial [Candidatus Binatota bacterium]|nr:hypothetical protein [Candidatus Binatota bacterium]
MPEDDLPENSADRPLTTSTRRSFLTRIGLGAAATVTAGVGGLPLVAPSEAEAREPRANRSRRYAAYAMRVACARIAYDRGRTAHPNNGEERDYPYVANYCKGLPHDQLGEVDPDAYRLLKAAVRSGEPDDFEAIPLAGERRLKNPLAGLAFDLEGADTHALTMRPHPRIDSPECSGEMAELYWHALARDVPFSEYASNEITNAAADDLSGLSDFRGPKVAGRVKPVTLFRGNGPGVTTGPYISQFL